jgi:hypothetical protein
MTVEIEVVIGVRNLPQLRAAVRALGVHAPEARLGGPAGRDQQRRCAQAPDELAEVWGGPDAVRTPLLPYRPAQ